MIGLLLFAIAVASGGWFAWLYLASPTSDQDRIKADQAGAGVRVINIERVGTRRERAEITWVAGHATPRSGGAWYRVYEVTVARPDGLSESYTVGVAARLFGFAGLKRIDDRS